jgi:Polyketide cyclase / dehydrase and lipid transport
MTRWFKLTPTDDDFFTSAPAITKHVLEVDVPAETLWAALAADDAVVSWGPGATACTWTGGKPYGVGTVREVTVAGVVTVREQFYRWDEGQRMTFFVAESTRPGIRRMAEDYVVQETATGSRLTWTVALEVSHLAGPTAVVVKPVLGMAVGSMVTGLKKKLAAR